MFVAQPSVTGQNTGSLYLQPYSGPSSGLSSTIFNLSVVDLKVG